MNSQSLLASSMSVYGSRNDRLTEKYLELGQLYDRRQWHQVMDALHGVVQDEGLWVDRNVLDLYRDFVEKFETKLNPLRLVLFTVAASRQHFTKEGFEPASQNELSMALEFMQHVASKAFLSEEARIVANMCICDYLVQMGRESEAKKILEEVGAKLAQLEGSGAETTVKSSFYRAESNYYKKVGPAGGKILSNYCRCSSAVAVKD